MVGPIAAVALGVTWPVLAPLAANPPFFIARGNPQASVIVVGLGVGLVLPALCGLLGLIPARTGDLLRLLLSATGWLVLVTKVVDHWIGSPQALMVVGAIGGTALAVYGETRATGRLLMRYLAISPLIITAYFLVLTPSGRLLSQDERPLLEGAADPHPIVMIVFDEFPTSVLMDARGDLQADAFPGFARLASDATWFRNAATVQQNTDRSLPAILTGIDPAQSMPPIAQAYPGSLFDLLRATHELHVIEPITAMCIDCPEDERTRRGLKQWLRTLAADMSIALQYAVLPEAIVAELPPIGDVWENFGGRLWEDAVATDRGLVIERFIQDIDVHPSRPAFHFLHVLLPHQPYQYLPDGRSYFVGPKHDIDPAAPLAAREWHATQLRQRLHLQVRYIDQQLASLLDRLEALGIYDDTMIVVTADHGLALGADARETRLLAPETMNRVGTIPLFIKLPGATEGSVDDYRAHTVDIVPTIANALDIPVPWAMDGSSLYGGDRPVRTATTTSGPGGEITWGAEVSGTIEAARDFYRDRDPLDPWSWTRTRGRQPGTLLPRSNDRSGVEATLDAPDLFARVERGAVRSPLLIEGDLMGFVPESATLVVTLNDVVGATTTPFLSDRGRMRYSFLVEPSLMPTGNVAVGLHIIGADGQVSLVTIHGTTLDD